MALSGEIMETSSLLLIASLGSIAVLLMLYVYFFAFERRFFLLLWFAGWFIIALNYSLDAFLPDFLRKNRLVFCLSLCSYFYANFLISWGTLLFLKIGTKKLYFWGIGAVWPVVFAVLSIQNLPAVHVIRYTYLSVFTLYILVGIIMIRLARLYGKHVLVLGLLNLAWVCNNLISSFILELPHMAPYVVSQLLLIINAVGLLQFYFKQQKDAIREGLENVTYLTLHDGLTGLYNKAYFDEKLREMENDRDRLPISLIVGDMNGLKFVNDVFGHHEGDQKLKKVAFVIRQCCRPDDIVARWGGDEFAVILPNTDNETAKSICDKIANACKSFKGVDTLLSLSLGMATRTDPEVDLLVVLREAEEVMYRNKLIEGRRVRGAITDILVKVLQESEHELKGHIDRLRILAKEFAGVLGFSAENRETLIQAAILHDIGKIGLMKDLDPEKVISDDMEHPVVRKHVEIGYRIAQASGEFAHLADIILYQHEWWNGQGYPHGLKGEKIPLMSRIISIMDAYDLMTHPHKDKPAMTAEEALLELGREAGSRFDPSLVELFTGMVREIDSPKEMCQGG